MAERTAAATLQTFKALGKIAGMIPSDTVKKTQPVRQKSRKSPSKIQALESIKKEADIPVEVKVGSKTISSPQLILNVNIQLAVPETTDEDVYDKFFAALKRNLMS